MNAFLLDTHALIWWTEGIKLSTAVVESLTLAFDNGALYYSPISFWEIGMLDSKEAYAFLPTFQTWTERAIAQSGAKSLDLKTNAAILSSRLPGDFHKDPADRLLVASALDAGATFVTRDTKILGWAQRTGALQVLAC
jgi:PIN domain nuclease of toxin-antitoxin system